MKTASRGGLSRLARLALVAVATVPVVVLLAVLVITRVPYLIAPLLNDTPEARLEDYLEAVARGDKDAAMQVWVVDSDFRAVELGARRTSVTGQLADQRPDSWSVDHAEWWSMCCMPHIIESRDRAGFVRFTVSVGGTPYRFDVIAVDRGGTWEGLPSRGWVLRDVYRVGDAPLFLTGPGT